MQEYLERIGFSLSDIVYMISESNHLPLKNQIHEIYRSAAYIEL